MVFWFAEQWPQQFMEPRGQTKREAGPGKFNEEWQKGSMKGSTNLACPES